MSEKMPTLPTLAELETEHRRKVLTQRLGMHGGVAARAARSLGISLRTFERHAQACGLRRASPCSREWLPSEPTTTHLS